LTIRNAEESVTLMTTSQGFLRKVEGLKPTFEKLKKRGVKIRIAAPLTKENMQVAKELSKFAEVKHVDKIGSRFCVVDGKELLFMIQEDNKVHESYDTGIWVKSPYFVKSLENLFEMNWKNLK